MQIDEVVARLAEERERFLSGSWRDAFGCAYFHVTTMELAQVEGGRRRYPDVRKAQIVAFYEAYVASRKAWADKRACSARWARYFTLADALSRGPRGPRLLYDPSERLVRLLEYGIDAHVRTDLAEGILKSFRGANVPPEKLWPDFAAMDAAIAHAATATLRDLDRATRTRVGPLRGARREVLEFGDWLLGRLGDGSSKIRRWRRDAWREAVAKFATDALS